MLKKIVSFIAAVTLGTSAFAGPKPPDVPSYVPVTPTYAAGTTKNVIGDGTSTGGTPPAAAYELTEVNTVADITPYTFTQSVAPLTFTGSISGTTLTVISGSVRIGDFLSGAGVNDTAQGLKINSSLGGGQYALVANSGATPSQTIASETMYSNNAGMCQESINGGPSNCTEAKFRSLIDTRSIKIGFDDPIRNYGLPGTSHCHTFFGNVSTNAYSTYATLRQRATGNPTKYAQAMGRPLNSTGYWVPCVVKTNPFGNGKNYALHPSGIILYYTNDPTKSPTITRLLLGLRYVTNYNMDDPEQTWLRKIIYAANRQPGTSITRYSLQHCTGSICVYNGQPKWQCQTSDGSGTLSVLDTTGRTYLKDGTGADPFNGHCRAGDDLWMQLTASARCWDGVNLWSTDGYHHVIPQIWDAIAPGGGDWICPNGWYQIPGLVLQIHYQGQQGWSDYQNWRLSSDDGAAAKLDSLPSCATDYSNAPCTTTSSPHTVLDGESYHTDWMNGWQRSIITQWLTNCIGIGNEGGTARQCDSSTISGTTALQYGFYATTSYNTSNAENMIQIGTQHSGPMTMHMNTHP